MDSVALDIGVRDDHLDNNSGDGSLVNTVKFDDGSCFEVVLIDSPKKWKDAKDIKFKKEVKVGEKKIILSLNCVSFSQYRYIADNFELPEKGSEGEDSENEAMESDIESIKIKRKVLYFEAATQKQLEGIDIEDKARRLLSKPVSLVDAVFDVINNFACAVIDNEFAEAYQFARSKYGERIEASDLNDIFSNKELSDRVFIIGRPFEETILQFPLHSIDGDERSRIENEFKIPSPPRRPGKGFDTSNPVPWTNEPMYVARCKNIKLKKMIAYLEACLSFKIPGDSFDEKLSWLDKKPVGDVIKLQIFIQRELIDTGMAIGFF
jgi:hypothetical protein